jgi:hypothetical protein
MIPQGQKEAGQNNELALRKTRSGVHLSNQNKAKGNSTNLYKDIHEGAISHANDPSRLNHQLVLALRIEYYTNRPFVPMSTMNKLVTQKSVNRELSRMEYLPAKISHRTWRPKTHFRVHPSPDHSSVQPPQPRPGLDTQSQPDKACYQQIFTTLLLMGRSKKIWSFVKEEVCDADLPLCKVRKGGIFELQRRGDPQLSLRCLKKQNDIDGFVTCQLYVLALNFGKPDGEKVSHCKAWKGQILPFVFWENISRRGGSAEVHKAEIHPDHHDFDKDQVSMTCSRTIR